MNRSKPRGATVPTLYYDDVAGAVDWLCVVFGFTERLRAGSSDGRVTHAQISTGNGGGIILGASRIGQGFAPSDEINDEARFAPPESKRVSQTLSVDVEDVERHHEYAKRHGALILSPPTTYPFGERQYTAQDPEGHRWTFSQSVADVNPEDWGASVVDLD